MFFVADVTHLTLGLADELWDEVAIVIYPNRKALVDMSTSPEWMAVSHHRAAGLDGQLNIETTLTPRLAAARVAKKTARIGCKKLEGEL